jgi:hypothetical protein
VTGKLNVPTRINVMTANSLKACDFQVKAADGTGVT